ncbi:DUF397 domain-containing protein [Streptomyces sp. NPDC049879]|uniref:DUF397 domain-containing protein n=1 Tax=Streptomyces sp. NPDC049879 TaxID=3365598 RepID=UPI003787450B
MTSETPRWYKSSYSDNGGACVEAADNFAATHGIVPVRDSKNPTGPELAFPTAAFASFVTSVKSGATGIA